MFYDRFDELCKVKDISQNKACVDCSISRSSPAKWRKGSIPEGDTLAKLAKYFNVTVDFLLTGEAEKPVTEDDELNRYLDELRTRPEMRMLFKLADGASKEDVEKAVKVVEALLNKD